MFPPIDWSSIENETIVHFRHLLRCDTRNPPGNERKVAEYLRTVLRQEGIVSEIVGPSSDRASLVARVHGDGSAPPLLLMSHTDVVAVEREKWTHDPFAQELHLFNRQMLLSSFSLFSLMRQLLTGVSMVCHSKACSSRNYGQ
jgi:hypothetical protein